MSPTFGKSVRAAVSGFRPSPRLLQILPGTSRIFGPPRHFKSGREFPERVRPVGKPPDIQFVEPTLLNAADVHWKKPCSIESPRQPYVFAAGRARLLWPGCWTVVDRDTFVFDTAFWGHRNLDEARRWHNIFRRKRVPPLRRIAGRVLSLASDFAPYSYGHWLIDSLPRWRIAEQAGFKAADFDHFYLPSPDTPSTQTIVSRLGLPLEKLLLTPLSEDLEFDDLTVTSFPGSPGSACSLAREMAVRSQRPQEPRRRIYLSRDGHSRTFIEHSGIRRVLTQFGFEECNPAKDPDTLAKCSEASVLLGIEGSGCFNALFAPAGAALVVISPDGFHPLPYMQSIAGAAGLRLYIVGSRAASEGSGCALSPNELRHALESILN